MEFDAKSFDRFLSENCVKPDWVQMHPKAWNGYWSVRKSNRFLRRLGRKLGSKRIYWLGFQVEWMHGLREYYEKHGIEYTAYEIERESD